MIFYLIYRLKISGSNRVLLSVGIFLLIMALITYLFISGFDRGRDPKKASLEDFAQHETPYDNFNLKSKGPIESKIGSSENEIPPTGTYTYNVEFAEHQGMFTQNAVDVIIDGMHILVINNGILSGEKGEIILEGIILKHQSGEWIIGQDDTDINSNEIGGCSDGPVVIYFKTKTILLC